MSLESVRAFQPFVAELESPRSLARGAIGDLARRVGSLLGGERRVAVSAQLTGVSGPPDVRGAIARALGGDPELEPRDRERLPSAGPVLVLVFHEDGTAALRSGDAPRGNLVSSASLARIVRSCGADVLLAVAHAHRRRAVLAAPIAAERLARIAKDRDLLRWLYARAEALRHRAASGDAELATTARWLAGAARVADPVAPELVAAELAALPHAQRLVESGRFMVVQGRAHQLPACVREIGRLRELTFRAVGEGTGRALDLDVHDRTYRHLVLFDREAGCIAGAYRFAPTDEILPVFGVRGLYTSTLFRLEPELFEALGPALELGRSFIRAEYQRAYAPLLLMWRGLCAFVAGSPRYRTLFGAVSIPDTYTPFSRALIATALGGAATLHPLSGHAAPRHPLIPSRALRRAIRTLPALLEDAAELSAVVADAERDGKGLPVLLREYLKLGGRLLGFSVDPGFGSVLDGLIAVDLARSERRLLDAFMGRERASAFLGHHAPLIRPDAPIPQGLEAASSEAGDTPVRTISTAGPLEASGMR